jgi:UDPglucose 6-dehydrogenase
MGYEFAEGGIVKIAVIGVGYVGLTTGVCLANRGHDVLCVDTDAEKVAALQKGQCPILEAGLEVLMCRNLQLGRLHFESSLATLDRYSDLIFIAVGTPEGDGGEPDLTSARQAVRQVAAYASPGAVVVIKSTVPPTALAGLEAEMHAVSGAKQLTFAVNPEFLRQGMAVTDTLRPERIVIGVTDAEARSRLLDLYALFAVPLVVTDPVSAMTIKYVANCFLATKVSFVNEVANLCERLGADIDAVTQGMGLDSRIGPKFLHAGVGFGGSCFPKDTVGLLHVAHSVGYDFRVLAAVVAVNDEQYKIVLEHLNAQLGPLRRRTIAVLGLAFKGGTDDTRETRSFPIIRGLLSAGAQVRSYDASVVRARLPGDIAGTMKDSLEACVAGADGVVITNNASDWSRVNWRSVARGMRGTLVIDGRNTLNADLVLEAGLEYRGVGRTRSAERSAGDVRKAESES